ncbi:MAG: DUF3574 domain-containing protein [Gammaproteobacteria bacterium]
MLATLAGSAWRVVAAPTCAPPSQPMARVQLLFGTTVDGGRTLGEDEWRRFVDEEVTPRFPEGLTELSGQGQWRRPDGVISHEPSRVLLIWYTPGTDRDRDIEAVRERYKTRFKQLSVMRVDGVDCVSF